MDNELRTIDECYTKFGLKNTSVSENKLPDDVRLQRKIVLTKDELNRIPQNSSFLMGTLIHEGVQAMLTKNVPVSDVMPVIEKKVSDYNSEIFFTTK